MIRSTARFALLQGGRTQNPDFVRFEQSWETKAVKHSLWQRLYFFVPLVSEN